MAFCIKCGKQLGNGQICDCLAREKTKSKSISHNHFIGRIKAWPYNSKRILLVIFALIIINLLFAAIGSAITAPVNTARGYFQAKANSNWSRAYGFLALERNESDFINRDSFISANRDIDITSFELEEMYSTSYVAGYFQRGSSIPRMESINLIRTGSRLLFFNRYEVNPNNLIIPGFQIITPPGTTIHFNGIDLSDHRDTDNEAGYFYMIPRIFSGLHEIRAEHPACEELNEEIQIDQSGMHVWVPTLVLNESVKSELAGMTESIFKNIVASALENRSFSSLNLQLTGNEYYNRDIENQYLRFASALFSGAEQDGYKVVDITGFTNKSTQTEFIDSGTYTNIMHVEFDYVYETQRGQDTTEHRDSKGYEIIFTYVFENNTWLLQNIYLGAEYWW